MHSPQLHGQESFAIQYVQKRIRTDLVSHQGALLHSFLEDYALLKLKGKIKKMSGRSRWQTKETTTTQLAGNLRAYGGRVTLDNTVGVSSCAAEKEKKNEWHTISATSSHAQRRPVQRSLSKLFSSVRRWRT